MRFRLWFGGRPGAADGSRGGAVPGSGGASRARARESLERTDHSGSASLDATTHALVTRIRAGDSAAFDTIYTDYFERLWRFAYQSVHSRDVAIDVVQDVFTDVWVRRASWEPTSVSAYLFRAVRNRLVSRRRHETTVASAVTDAAVQYGDVPALGAPALPPDDDVASRDMDIRLRHAIDQLTERQRAAVLLRWDQGLNSVETAAVLGVSEAAVRKLLAHARERLEPVIRERRTPE